MNFLFGKITVNTVEELEIVNKKLSEMEDMRSRFCHNFIPFEEGITLPCEIVIKSVERMVYYTSIDSNTDAVDITEEFFKDGFQVFNWKKLMDFVGTCDWDIPMEGKAVINFVDYEDPAINLFLEYGIISINERDPKNPYRFTKYVVDQHSAKYDMYKYENNAIYGAKLWEGKYSWAQLKLFTFASHRNPDKKAIQQFLDKIAHIPPMYQESHFQIQECLEDGYDETPIDSCMQGNGEYYKNFEGSGVLLTFNNDTYVGRAIIWSDQYLTGLPEGCQGFMDRIYPSGNHKVVQVFKEYAKNHGLLCKKYQSYDDKDIFEWDGQDVQLELKLSPPNANTNKKYPYMDTLSWANSDFTQFSNNWRFSNCKLDSTDGGNSASAYCCCCDSSIDDDDDSIYRNNNGDVYCHDCYYEYYTTCDCCGEEVSRSNVEKSDKYREICPSCISSEDFQYCKDISLYSRYYTHTADGYYYHSTESLYKTADTDEYFSSNHMLTFTYDTEKYFRNFDKLHYNPITGKWYENKID